MPDMPMGEMVRHAIAVLGEHEPEAAAKLEVSDWTSAITQWQRGSGSRLRGKGPGKWEVLASTCETAFGTTVDWKTLQKQWGSWRKAAF